MSIWPGKQTVGKHLSVWESDGARLVPKLRTVNLIIYRIHANVTWLLALTVYIITSLWIEFKVHLILQLEKLYKVSIIIQDFPRVVTSAYSNVTEVSNALSNWLWNFLKVMTWYVHSLKNMPLGSSLPLVINQLQTNYKSKLTAVTIDAWWCLAKLDKTL